MISFPKGYYVMPSWRWMKTFRLCNLEKQPREKLVMLGRAVSYQFHEHRWLCKKKKYIDPDIHLSDEYLRRKISTYYNALDLDTDGWSKHKTRIGLAVAEGRL